MILRKLLMLVFLAVVVCVMSPGVGAAAVITVDDSGGADFTSIQAAVAAASVGDTIDVWSGTYVENMDVGKRLTLIGDDTGKYGVFLQSTNNLGNATPLNFGETIAGTIDVPGEMDNYTFSAQAGDQIIAHMGSSWINFAQLQLYAPNGTLIEEDYGSRTCTLEITLVDTGIYTLLASDKNGDDTGDYGVFLQKINNPVNATPLGFGETITGNISQLVEMDTYIFSAEVGDSIIARMGSSWFNHPAIKLYAPNGTLIGTKSGQYVCELTEMIPETGNYTLLVGDYSSNDIGEYGIFLQRTSNPVNVTPIGFGDTLKGNITHHGGMNTYTFTAEKGDSVFTRMSAKYPNKSELQLYAPNGTLIEKVISYYSEITVEIIEYGTYTILSGESNGKKNMEYGIYLQRLSNPINAQNLEFGDTVIANITQMAEFDTYTFSAQAGDKIFALLRSNFSHENLRLYAPNGTLIKEDIGGDYGKEITATLTDTGNYTLIGGTKSYYTGNYWIYLQRINNPNNATSIEFGETQQENISYLAEIDTYTFQALAGDHIIARMDHNAITEKLHLISPNGDLIKKASSYAEIITPLQYNGTYILLASDSTGEKTGEYCVYLQRTNNPVNSTPIQFGETVSGIINHSAEMAAYTFTGEAGDCIFARMPHNPLNSNLQLYAPNGTLLEDAQYRFYPAPQLPESGVYTLLAGDIQLSHIGNYEVFLQRTNNPKNATPIEFSESIEGNISQPAHYDTYVFSGRKNDSILVRMGSDQLDIDLWLYSPDGTWIHRLGFHYEDFLAVLPDNGTYTFLAGDRSGDDIGDYGVFIQRTNNPVNTTCIGIGDTIAGTITQMAKMDTYTFSAQAGDRIISRIGADWNSNPEIKLFNPNGSLIEMGYHQILTLIPTSGNYILLAGESHGSYYFGNYGVFLQSTCNPVNATSIAFGETITGNIEKPAEMDAYTFSAQKGDQIDAQMEANNPLRPKLQLFSTNGTMIEEGSDQLKTIIFNDGTYTLLAGDRLWVNTGYYNVSLEVKRPVPLFIDQTLSGNVSSNSWDFFYLTVLEGENLLIQVEPYVSTGEIEVYGSLEGIPTETDFDYIQKEKNPQGIYDLLISPTKSGTYYIGIHAKDNPDHLEYSITPSLGEQYISNFYPGTVINNSHAWIHIYGFGFTNDMRVELRKNTTTIPAQSLVYASPTTYIAYFDLTTNALGTYDLAVIWPDNSERVFNDSIEIAAVLQGAIFIDTECAIEGGVTCSYDIEVHETDNLFITLQQTTLHWHGKLSILYNGEVIASKGGYRDLMIQIVDPEPGVYTVNITGKAGNAILTVWTALPELPLGEWTVDTIHSSGSVWYQIDVPINQDYLFFEGEGVGLGSHFDIYYEVYESSDHWVSPMEGEERYTSLEIPNPLYGTYIVEFYDSAWVFNRVGDKTDQSRDVLIRAAISKQFEPPLNYLPIITSFTPKRGGNTGLVSVEIQGAWLDSNATVSLFQPGKETINAVEVDRELNSTSLLATFNFVNKDPGEYNLIVTNPDGWNATAPVPFILEEGGKAELWFEIVGREKIRIGRPATYFLKYGNRGTLDMPAPLFALSITPPSSKVSVSIDSSEWHQMNGAVTVLGIGPSQCPEILPAGYSNSIPFKISSVDYSQFSLLVSPITTDPVFTPPSFSSTIDSFCPTPGTPLALSRAYPNSYSSYLGPFGYGWVHSYGMRLEKLCDGNIAVKDGGSYLITFKNNGTNTYSSLQGPKTSTLQYNPNGTYFINETGSHTIKFRSDMLLDSITDMNENQISMYYNIQNQLVRIQHSCGGNFTLNYNGDGRISRLIDHAGQIVLYTYDSSGDLLTSVTGPDGSVTEYEYTDLEDYLYLRKVIMTGPPPSPSYALLSITNPGGTQLHMNYDGDARLTKTYLNGDKYPVQVSYDVSNRTTTFIDSTGSSTTKQLNDFGQIQWDKNPLGNIIHYDYDIDHNLVVLTDPKGGTYNFEYDDNENPVCIRNPLNHEVTIGYNPAFDKISWVMDARDNQIDFDYDDNGNVDQITYPDSTKEDITYDQTGNPITVTTRKGDDISYTYNQRGQITRKDYPDGTWTTYTYDNTGNMLTAADQTGTISMTCNLRNQLTHISYPGGHWLNYNYNDAGWLVQRRDQDNNMLNYEYNVVGQLIRLSDGTGAPIVQYEYNALGALSRKTLGNDDYTTYEYDAAGQILHLVNYNSTGSVLSRFDYTYDQNGNPIVIETLEGVSQFGYDRIGQLISVTYPDGSSVSYSYDEAGNRISVVDDGVTTSYTTNNMNQYTLVGSTTYEYDQNGNLISETTDGETTLYEYNFENRLVGVTTPEGAWQYNYDALGNRISMVHNGTDHWYFIDPSGLGDVLAEYDGNGNLTARYIHGFGLISQIDASGDEYFYHFNPTGHTMEITNENGDIVNEYLYAPFGEYIKKDESIRNPFTYVGEYGVMDDVNGIQYMRMRYYLPELGRFSSDDPILIYGKNQYVYVINNPMKYIDPQGLRFWIFIVNVGNFIMDILYNIVDYNPSLTYPSIAPIGLGHMAYLGKWAEQDPEITIIAFKDLPKRGIHGYSSLDKVDEEKYGVPPGYFDLYEQKKKPIFPKGSTTPEDKYGPAGFDLPDTPSNESNRFVPPNQQFHYRVDFWNHENTTAPACDVYIYDDLETTLNHSTFHFTEIGFLNWTIPLEPCQYFNIDIDTQPEMNLIVNIEGILDPDTGRINVTYRSLDPATWETPEDPMAGFLPPITESWYEIGWVCFAADAVSGLPTGTEVRNQAWVNFDGVGPTNPAPKEGPWTNTIDAGKPSSSVTASLVNQTEIHLNINGMDDAGGSGILGYTIYASMDGGNYQPWLNHIAVNETIVNGLAGHTYAFYSVAEDLVGHIEDAPEEPDVIIDIHIVQPLIITITLPIHDNMYNTNSVDLNYSVNEPIVWQGYSLDGSANITLDGNITLIGLNDGLHTLTVYANNTAGNMNSTTVWFTVDTTPPEGMSNLQHMEGQTWINFTWTNPPDPDFNHTELYLNSTFLTNIPAPQNYYNITGLLPDTSYELSTRTVDINGNINLTWVNDTASTLPASGTTLNLYTGWNLISLPLMPEDTSITSLLSSINGNYSIVWEYSASDTADHWKKYDPATPFGNDLTTMEPGKGYWIMMNSDDILNISGMMPEPTDIELWSGWNLIGYNSLNPQTITGALSSISGNYSIVWAYDASDTADHWKKYDPLAPFGNDLEIMEPGKGYWIMMSANDYLRYSFSPKYEVM